MTSAGPAPVEKTQVKLSFAKVAASSYKSQNTKEPQPSSNPAETNSQPTIQLPNASRPGPSSDMPKVRAGQSNGNDANVKADSTESRTGQWANLAGQRVSSRPDSTEEEGEKLHPGITLVKSLATEDNATQLSSSDGSAKPASLDGKSVASATTFALDEKESIRPDDSASLRAVEEEDVASPPDSVAAGSRVGSDSGVGRAFRDQLHEIAAMGPTQRGAPPGRFPNLNLSGPHTLYDPNQPSNGVGRPMSQPIVNGMPIMAGQHVIPSGPDEKLIEALESPRDRLFVLKLEQDFIDFIKDSRESEFTLPSTNTFYRMLAHRLAEYYLLGHMVDDTMTGVKISRTPHCRIAPPLSGLPVSSKTTNTPPVDMPARKIMRRGEDGKSGTNTTANSEGPSKTTSEAGGGSGSDEGNDGENKDKSALTREEREARYREARQRIFGISENGEGETADAVGSGEDKDVSRSSSASGKKKNKKQRNYDDDFEARSRFNAYYPQSYGAPAFGGDQAVYYGGYSGHMPSQQYPGMNSNMSPPSNYGNGYPTMMQQDSQAQYGWPGQQYPSPNMSMAYPSYNSAQNGYDLSGEFQRNMSFQSPSMPSSQMTPKMANAPMASYQDPYQAQPMSMNGGWPQMNQPSGYGGAQPTYAQTGPGNRPMSAPMQGPPGGQYPYGQLPNSPYNGMSNRNQHPLPGSFNRQQFNPQSQAFIPGSRNGPFQMQSLPPQGMNGYTNSFPLPAVNQSPNQVVPTSPPVAHSQVYGSQQGMQNNMSMSSKPNGMHPSQTPTSPQISSQMNSSQSSIAKWGTPSHLPPRPPPSTQQSSKFGHSGNSSFPSLPRLPSNMTPGYNPNPAFGGPGSNMTNTQSS